MYNIAKRAANFREESPVTFSKNSLILFASTCETLKEALYSWHIKIHLHHTLEGR